MSAVQSHFTRLVVGTSAIVVLHAHAVDAQTVPTPPAVYSACYVPLTGTVYRIKESGLKPTCTTGHIEFNWTDGANAIRTTDRVAGDLNGFFTNPTVVRLLGRALSSNPPSPGQVLTWDGTAWSPATLPVPPGGATDHGALTGLNDDDHPQYLLTDGVRASVNGFAVTGTYGVGTMQVAGPGSRFVWIPGKAALRAGIALATEWDEANVGRRSVALGIGTTASGESSTAFGELTIASGLASTALGQRTEASAYASTALGASTVANATYSVAMGLSTQAEGSASVAMGQGSRSVGTASLAAGSSSTAIGNSSVALGEAALASGARAVALGFQTRAAGDQTTAMGSFVSTDGYRGSFLYGDAESGGSYLSAGANNEFAVRASGGVRLRTSPSLGTGCNLPAGSGTWVCTSSRLAKERFENLNGDDVLAKIARMPIQSWSYRTEPGGVRHVGPTAQDFRAAFGLGNSDDAISLVDIDGINMLGVQALVQRTQALQRQNDELRARLDRLEAVLRRFETSNRIRQ